jgi:hypothetical protein
LPIFAGCEIVESCSCIQKTFLFLTNAAHRQYETLRTYFADNISSQVLAESFGYTLGSFRLLCAQFRQNFGPFLPYLSATPLAG